MRRTSLLLLAAALLCSAQNKPVNATIDASKTGAPISKYVYGQFLEHAGSLVNGGIWAEMIDDRKFYYTIDSKSPAPAATRGRQPNPWRPIGPDESVVMDSEVR